MSYLLDTNAWIEVLNNPKGQLAAKLAAQVPRDVALCSIVLAELVVGLQELSASGQFSIDPPASLPIRMPRF